MASVSAVIPTFNRADLLAACLDSLVRQTRAVEQIIVVDNGSADATPRVMRQFAVEPIVFPENRGFAPAVNAGIEKARCEWILILNNDVLLPPEWLERVLNAAELQQADVACGKITKLDDSGLIDGTWDLISRGGHAWRSGHGRPASAEPWSKSRAVGFVPMTAALFRRAVFSRVGMLDECFDAYYEDVDFGVRCLLASVRAVYEPTAVARHGSKSTLGGRSSRVIFLTARNQVLILAKHYPASTLLGWAWPVAVGQALSLIGAARQGQFFAALRGYWAGLRMWARVRGTNLDARRLESALTSSEREIFELQKENGYDPYWKLYFRLVHAG